MLNILILFLMVQFLHYAHNKGARLRVAERCRLRGYGGNTVRRNLGDTDSLNGIAAVAACFMFTAICTPAAATDLRLVRTVDPEDMVTIKAADAWMVIEGSGRLVFPPNAQSLVLFDDPDDPTESVALIDPSKKESGYIADEIRIGDAINVTMLPGGPSDRLFAFDVTTDEIVSISRAGKFWSNVKSIERHDASSLAVIAPAGMAANSKTGELFILDPGSKSIIVLKPAPGMRYEPAITGDHRYMSRISLPPDIGSVRGLAHDSDSGEFFVLLVKSRSLLRLSPDGELSGVYEIPEVDASRVKGFAVAPSLDRTDDPSIMHLFIAAPRGVIELSVSGKR